MRMQQKKTARLVLFFALLPTWYIPGMKTIPTFVLFVVPGINHIIHTPYNNKSIWDQVRYQNIRVVVGTGFQAEKCGAVLPYGGNF